MPGIWEDDATPAVPKTTNSIWEHDAQPVAGPTPPAKDGDSGIVGRIGHFVGGLLGGPLKAAAGALSAPVTELTKVTGAPPRAFVGALQQGQGLGGAASAFGDQMVAGLPSVDASGIHGGTILPSTPTGADLASKGMASFGIAKPYADAMAPVMGAGADAVLDLTQGLPGELLKGAIGAGAHVLGAGLGSAGLDLAEGLGIKAAANAGQTMTRGTMSATDALQASKILTAREMLLPGSKNYGALADAMTARATAEQAMRASDLTVPNSHAIAQNTMAAVQASVGKTLSAEQATDMINMIKSKAFDQVPQTVSRTLAPWEADALAKETEQGLTAVTAKIAQIDEQRANAVVSTLMSRGHEVNADNIAALVPELDAHPGLSAMDKTRSSLDAQAKQMQGTLVDLNHSKATGQPFTQQSTQMVPQQRDMTLAEIDDVAGAMDKTIFGGAPSKNLAQVYGQSLADSRSALSDIMSTTPEGELFQAAKEKESALQRLSKPDTSAQVKLSTTIPGAVLAVATSPNTYGRLIGALKLPGEVADTIGSAIASGKAAIVNSAIGQMAAKYPMATERLLRGLVLINQKPQQTITPDEAKTLGANRVFDASQIIAEKQRIKSDDSMSSVDKASALSTINKNGYVTIPGPEPTQQIEPKQEPPEDTMASFSRSLRSMGGK